MNDINNIFNHKIKKDELKIKWEKVIYDDDNYQLRKFLNTLNKTQKGFIQKNLKRFYSDFERRFPQKQRVMFKMHFGKSMESHNKYLHTYMVQKEENDVTEKPELFGTEINEYEEHKSDFHFKCIISPESQDVDLKTLVYDFIKKVEYNTGYKLYWEAAIHTNTNHHHAHLCINGIDRNGRQVYFDKMFIKKHMRMLLSTTCTDLIGERSWKEIELEKQNMITAKRFTELDQKFLEYEKDSFILSKLPPQLQNRILFLADLNLAQKLDKKTYKLNDNWMNVLMYGGRYNTYLEEYFKDNELKLYPGGIIYGKVEKVINFDKDESWNDAVIIKTKSGEKFYIPVYQLQKEDLLDKTIKIKGKENNIGLQIKDTDITIMKSGNSLKNKNINFDKHN
jgi:hypothetical protein